MTIRVPIMTMVGAEGGDDYHYGNNVHAGAGDYRVTTSVDGVRAGFAVQLRAAPAVPVPETMASVTLPGTGLPPASAILTTGCWANAAPPGPPPG